MVYRSTEHFPQYPDFTADEVPPRQKLIEGYKVTDVTSFECADKKSVFASP